MTELMDHRGLTLLIPCLNEATTIQSAVERAREALARNGCDFEILVIDNASTDRSAELARAAGARVVTCPERGYGRVLQKGVTEARFGIIVMLDADLSYPFELIPDLVEKLQSGYDLVLGNRLEGEIEDGAMPWLNRHLGTPTLSFVIRLFFGIPTHDCNSGMRAFRKEAILSLGLESHGMEWASEMLVRAASHRLKYGEIPISFFKDGRGRPPHLRRWRDGIRHLRLITRTALKKRSISFTQ